VRDGRLLAVVEEIGGAGLLGWRHWGDLTRRVCQAAADMALFL
jgi:hypothetical protein